MSTASRGLRFEELVCQLLTEKLASGELGILPSCAAIHFRKRYASRDRGSRIQFDVAIEVRMEGHGDPYLIWLWECKAAGRPIQVDVIEEFHAKVQQVGSDRTKATVVARSKFQRAAIAFARAHGIGLARVVPPSRHVSMISSMVMPTGPPTQEELEVGLDSSRRSQIGLCFYGMTRSGTYVAALEELMVHEIRLSALNCK